MCSVTSVSSTTTIIKKEKLLDLLFANIEDPPPARADAVARHLEPEPPPRRSQVPVLPVDKY